MICEEIMKRQVACVSPQDPIESAARQMRDQNIGFLPICDPSKKVLGTLTDRDIVVRVVAEALPMSTRVEEAMSREVVACKPSDTLESAEQKMAQNQKSRVLVLNDDGTLAGVISLSDIAQHDGGRIHETMRQVTGREAHPH
jgi:CBS domain-containing protein